MPRRPSALLTDAELPLMDALWNSGSATVEEVIALLDRDGGKPAHNTVLTILRILEKKGYVGHRRAGRAFRFYPVVDRRLARRSALRHLLARFFDDSPGLLVQNLIEQESLSDEEMKGLRRLIDGEESR